MTEKFRNDGARRMTEGKLPIRKISRELGVAASTVSRWASGDRQPEPSHAAKLEKLHGVPASAWGRQATSPAATVPTVPEAARDVLAGVMEHLPAAAPPVGIVVAALAELKALVGDLEGDPAVEELRAAVEAARAEVVDVAVPCWGSIVLVGLVACGAPGAAAALAEALRAVEGLS